MASLPSTAFMLLEHALKIVYTTNTGDDGMDRRELTAKREQILQAAARRGVRRIRIFGSMARGEAGPSSDVDFLVKFEPGRSL